MTLGIIDHPERARKTLKSYGITLRKARLTVENMFRGEKDDAADGDANRGVLFTMSPQLLNMNKKARDVELPFAPSLKRSLTLAGTIADSLQSATVNSEHVLLALLGYDPVVGRVPDEIDAAVEERGYAKGALAVFLRMEGMDSSSFSSVEFCRRLIMDIKYPESAEGPQLVTGKDGDLSTPTLMQVGMDLTEAARRMELDPVSGRDEEIGAAVRTLVRRRKNNPWYVLGVSGILAANTRQRSPVCHDMI
jgi:ATP-dependent Clp protease ATP-binding subunit ClpA